MERQHKLLSYTSNQGICVSVAYQFAWDLWRVLNWIFPLLLLDPIRNRLLRWKINHENASTRMLEMRRRKGTTAIKITKKITDLNKQLLLSGIFNSIYSLHFCSSVKWYECCPANPLLVRFQHLFISINFYLKISQFVNGIYFIIRKMSTNRIIINCKCIFILAAAAALSSGCIHSISAKCIKPRARTQCSPSIISVTSNRLATICNWFSNCNNCSWVQLIPLSTAACTFVMYTLNAFATHYLTPQLVDTHAQCTLLCTKRFSGYFKT